MCCILVVLIYIYDLKVVDQVVKHRRSRPREKDETTCIHKSRLCAGCDITYGRFETMIALVSPHGVAGRKIHLRWSGCSAEIDTTNNFTTGFTNRQTAGLQQFSEAIARHFVDSELA